MAPGLFWTAAAYNFHSAPRRDFIAGCWRRSWLTRSAPRPGCLARARRMRTRDEHHHHQQPKRPHLRRRQARHEGVGRGGRSSEVRAERPTQPGLRPAARRPAHPARFGVKPRRDGLRGHARSMRAACVGQTGAGRSVRTPARIAQQKRVGAGRGPGLWPGPQGGGCRRPHAPLCTCRCGPQAPRLGQRCSKGLCALMLIRGQTAVRNKIVPLW